jgi:hypothetical protein
VLALAGYYDSSPFRVQVNAFFGIVGLVTVALLAGELVSRWIISGWELASQFQRGPAKNRAAP